jgi:hypothetical protein
MIRAYPMTRERAPRSVWTALDELRAELAATERDVPALVYLAALEGTRRGVALAMLWIVAAWLLDGAVWALQAVPLPTRLMLITGPVWRVKWLGWLFDWNDVIAEQLAAPIIVNPPPVGEGVPLSEEQLRELARTEGSC